MPRRRRDVLFGAAALLAGWQILAWIIDRPTMPGVWRTTSATIELFTDHAGTGHLLTTSKRIAVALLLGLVFGAVLGSLIAGLHWRVASASLDLFAAVPKIALLPTLLAISGFGEMSKFVLLMTVIAPHVALAVRDALWSTDGGAIEVLADLGASPVQIARFAVLPAAPAVALGSVSTVLGPAVALAFIAESFGTRSGLGALAWEAWALHRYDLTVACAGVMTMMAFGMGYVLRAGLQAVAPWAADQRNARFAP
jgi:NitT/TauT family transport system permease protein